MDSPITTAARELCVPAHPAAEHANYLWTADAAFRARVSAAVPEGVPNAGAYYYSLSAPAERAAIEDAWFRDLVGHEARCLFADRWINSGERAQYVARLGCADDEAVCRLLARHGDERFCEYLSCKSFKVFRGAGERVWDELLGDEAKNDFLRTTFQKLRGGLTLVPTWDGPAWKRQMAARGAGAKSPVDG
jgi:hypothetical protein